MRSSSLVVVVVVAVTSLCTACSNSSSGGGPGGAQFDSGGGDATFDSPAMEASADAGGSSDAPPDVPSSDAADAGSDAPSEAGAPLCDGGCTIVFASGTDWESYAGDLNGIDGGDLGPARLVCLNAGSPPNCPLDAGAVLEGWGGGGWGQSLSNAPGAYWIWRGDIDAGAVSDSVIAVYQKTFTLGANPTGSIYLTGDDFAEVRVNGVTVGSIGSTTNPGQSGGGQALMMFDLTPQLHAGDNTITVVGQNGGPGFNGGCSPCTYAGNPAGTVFGGTLQY